MSPGLMQSEAVDFILDFSSRRSLQTTADEESTFEDDLVESLVKAMPAGLTSDNVMVAQIDTSSKYKVTVIGLEELDEIDSTDIISSVSNDTFVAALETDLGVSVVLDTAPTVIMRTTPVPSPPPSVPPPSPPSPPRFPMSAGIGASASGLTNTGDELSFEATVVITIGVLCFLVLAGCCVSYWWGKSNGKTSMVNVTARGRPAVRRQPSTGREPPDSPHEVSASAAPTDVRINPQDVRLVELGMAIQRQNSQNSQGARSPRGEGGMTFPSNPEAMARAHEALAIGMTQVALSRQGSHESPSRRPSLSMPGTDLDTRIDAVQAAIDEVRILAGTIASNSPSPRGSDRSPRSLASLEDEVGEEPAAGGVQGHLFI